MRTLNRNKKTFYYCLYQGKTPVLDEYGNYTSEYKISYYPQVMVRANISPATGVSQMEQFGNLENYDKVIVTDDVTIPIDENSVLFVDKIPEFKEDGTPLYDYIVKKIARSLNSVSIAISKVKIS